MELQNKILQDAFIRLALPLAQRDAFKQTPMYSTDLEHTYNCAMVCSAEVPKARSGIRNSGAVSVCYGAKSLGLFKILYCNQTNYC